VVNGDFEKKLLKKELILLMMDD